MSRSELIETAVLAQGDEVRAGFRPSEQEAVLSRDFLFALRCLGDQIPLDAKVTDKLLRRAIDEFAHKTGPARFTRYSDQLAQRFDAMRGGESGATALALVLAESQGLAPARLVRAAWIVMLVAESTDAAASMLEDALEAGDRTATQDALLLIPGLRAAPPSLVARLGTLALSGGEYANSAAQALMTFPIEPDLAADVAAALVRRAEAYPRFQWLTSRQ